jgi:hypothetical protein
VLPSPIFLGSTQDYLKHEAHPAETLPSTAGATIQ